MKSYKHFTLNKRICLQDLQKKGPCGAFAQGSLGNAGDLCFGEKTIPQSTSLTAPFAQGRLENAGFFILLYI